MRFAGIVALSLFWLVLVLNILWPFDAPWAGYLNMAFMLLVIVHVVEFILFRTRIRDSGDPIGKAIGLTMLYGMFYLTSLPKKPDAS